MSLRVWSVPIHQNCSCISIMHTSDHKSRFVADGETPPPPFPSPPRGPCRRPRPPLRHLHPLTPRPPTATALPPPALHPTAPPLLRGSAPAQGPSVQAAHSALRARWRRKMLGLEWCPSYVAGSQPSPQAGFRGSPGFQLSSTVMVIRVGEHGPGHLRVAVVRDRGFVCYFQPQKRERKDVVSESFRIAARDRVCFWGGRRPFFFNLDIQIHPIIAASQVALWPDVRAKVPPPPSRWSMEPSNASLFPLPPWPSSLGSLKG